MKWYFIDESITDGERRQGPYTIDDIREFVKQGKIIDTTLVWHSGEEDWKPWSAYKEDEPPADINNDQAREELLQNTIKALEEAMKNEQFVMRRYAGFFTRMAAFLIDIFILGFFGGIVLCTLAVLGFIDLKALQEAVDSVPNPVTADAINKLASIPGVGPFITLSGLFQAIYFIVFHAIFSATPGKMIMRIHVETREGNKIGWIGSVARYLCSLFTQATLPFLYGLGYLIVLVDPKRRALHDWIARTSVVLNEESKISKTTHSESKGETKDESKEN